MDKLSP